MKVNNYSGFQSHCVDWIT